eukprot:240119_1
MSSSCLLTTFCLFCRVSLIQSAQSLYQSHENHCLTEWLVETNIEELSQTGWTKCYLEAYSDATSSSKLTADCPTEEGYSLFVGAYDTNDGSVIGATAPSNVLTTITRSQTLAYRPQGPWILFWPDYSSYWYNYPTKSFGFSTATPYIDLQDADIAPNDCCGLTWNERLSWYLDGDTGGYRAPLLTEDLTNNTYMYKAIYYKYCPMPLDIRQNISSDWEDLFDEVAEEGLIEPSGSIIVTVISAVVIIIIFYLILITTQIIQMRRHISTQVTQSQPAQHVSVWKEYTIPITIFISLLAAYDIVGDIYFLSTILTKPQLESTDLVLDVQLNSNDGLVGCDMNDEYYYFCEPNKTEPTRYDLDGLLSRGYYYHTGDSVRDGLIDDSEWVNVGPITTTLHGISCYDLFLDSSLYTGLNSELFINFDHCLHHANGCNSCPQACGFNDLFAQCEEEYMCQRTYSISGIGMIMCSESISPDSMYMYYLSLPTWMTTMVVLLLVSIVVKEIVKIWFIISFFLSLKAQKDYFLRVSMNSPLTGIFIVFSERFRKRIYEIKMDSSSNRTCGLFLDLFFEDLPQCFLPIYMQIHASGYELENIISLSGSILMVIFNVAMLIKYMCDDYKKTLQANMNPNMQITPQKTKNSTNEFKLVFYADFEQHLGTEDTDKYYMLLVNNGFDNLTAFKTLTFDDLNEIGIVKLGHKRILTGNTDV